MVVVVVSSTGVVSDVFAAYPACALDCAGLACSRVGRCWFRFVPMETKKTIEPWDGFNMHVAFSCTQLSGIVIPLVSASTQPEKQQPENQNRKQTDPTVSLRGDPGARRQRLPGQQEEAHHPPPHPAGDSQRRGAQQAAGARDHRGGWSAAQHPRRAYPQEGRRHAGGRAVRGPAGSASAAFL